MSLHVILVATCLLLKITHAHNGMPCTTPNGDIAKCISIMECPPFLQALRGRTVEQTKFMRESQCGYQTHPLVCCGDHVNFKATANTANETSNELNDEKHKDANPHSLVPDKSICGAEVTDRLLFGENSGLDESAWLTLLEYKNESGHKTFACGGALISSRYILTSAHCVSGRTMQKFGKLISIRLGEWNIDNPGMDCIGFQFAYCTDSPVDVPVESTAVHPEYVDTDKYHDIALVRLTKVVKFTDFIMPICLPIVNESSWIGERRVIAGWGRTDRRYYHSIKQRRVVKLFDRAKCSSTLSPLGVKIGNAQICAQVMDTNNTCKGDSGGPLMGYNPDGVYVEGVSSLDYNCGTQDWVGVYTNVTEHLEWIYKTIKP